MTYISTETDSPFGRPCSNAVPENHAEVIMAKVIEFYIPACFRKAAKWVPQEQRGRVLEFPVAQKRTA